MVLVADSILGPDVAISSYNFASNMSSSRGICKGATLNDDNKIAFPMPTE